MSIVPKRDQRIKTTITVPDVRIPRTVIGVRNPPGWGSLDIRIRAAGAPSVQKDFQKVEPAGDPPDDWTGTRPEWAIFWGLQRNGLQPGEDFTYLANLPGVGAGYYSQVDFLIPDYQIAIEVQGKYWHYGQGSRKIFTDMFRVAAFQNQGIHVIFIDETDALDDPRYYVSEALKGNDHSHVVNTGKPQ